MLLGRRLVSGFVGAGGGAAALQPPDTKKGQCDVTLLLQDDNE